VGVVIRTPYDGINIIYLNQRVYAQPPSDLNQKIVGFQWALSDATHAIGESFSRSGVSWACRIVYSKSIIGSSVGDRDIELMRLHLMDTRCCRELDVSNRSTYKRNKIFKSADLKIYRYLCRNCEDTFGFYVNGCIPEDIENFLGKLPKQPKEILTPLGVPVARLSWDTIISNTAIMFRYKWSNKHGTREQKMPIFQEVWTKEDILGITMSEVDHQYKPPDNAVATAFEQLKEKGPLFPRLP